MISDQAIGFAQRSVASPVVSHNVENPDSDSGDQPSESVAENKVDVTASTGDKLGYAVILLMLAIGVSGVVLFELRRRRNNWYY